MMASYVSKNIGRRSDIELCIEEDVLDVEDVEVPDVVVLVEEEVLVEVEVVVVPSGSNT